MKTGLASPEPEVLIKEARRHQRRRYAVVAVAVAGLLGSIAGVLVGLRASGHGHRKPSVAVKRVLPGPGPIPRSLGTTVLMWPVGYPGFTPTSGPDAYVDDLSAGRLIQSGAVAIGAGDYQPLAARVGRWIVYVANGTTAIRADLRGKPRVLGPTPLFAPAADPRHVWLFRVRGMRHHPVQVQARLVPLNGGKPGPPITLPPGTIPPVVAGTDAGLLLPRPSGAMALWHPGGSPRTLPYWGTSSDGFDATARLVAYGTRCASQVTVRNAGYETCAMLRILNVVTGKLISFAAPPGTAGWVPNGFDLVSAISPGDQMIAAYAATRPEGLGRTRLYLASITRPYRRPREVPSSSALLYARTAWSVKGSWLLYQGPGRHLWAYQVASGKTRASATPCCVYTVMAAVPSHSGPGRSG